MGLFDFFTGDIAIDLGTANTLIIHKDKVVVDEPNSAEILDWAQLINVEVATGAFHSTGTSSVVIEALS